MSTNPGSAVGTNAAYGGRTSVKAFNDALAMFPSRGILSGWACEPVGEMTVRLGGDGVNRDVAVAENANGDRISVNNRSEMPIEVTLEEAPESGSRVDAIVAYVVDPPIGAAVYVDNPDACGLIVASSTTGVPDDGAIRTAITADGESGETAYYVVLATISVAAGVTNITAADITAGDNIDIKNVEVEDAQKVNGHTVEADVPAGAQFTDTKPNDAKITIKANETEVGDFTANAAADKEIVIPAASTSGYGVTKLSDAVDSDDQTIAATANAVKQVYDMIGQAGGGTITEVQANGTSVAKSGIANIPAATTSKYGVTQLTSSTSSTSTTLAATASAVKSAYDLATTANNKVRYGTSAPASTLGNNGDIYVVYES